MLSSALENDNLTHEAVHARRGNIYMHTVAQPLVQFGTFPESLVFILCVLLVRNPLKAFGKGDAKHET